MSEFEIKVIGAAELMAMPLRSDKELGDFKMDQKWLTLPWGGYDYDIELSRVNTPEKAMAMIAHIAIKRWKGMTAEKIGYLASALCTRFKWDRSW